MVQRVKYFARGVWVDRHLSQWFTSVMIMIHVGLGLVVLVGGVDRFPEPSYNPLVDLSQGHTWIWGVWILLSGALMAAPFRFATVVGLWLGLFWHVIWMSCFAVAVANFEQAAATPIPVYGGLALLCTALLTARVIESNEM